MRTALLLLPEALVLLCAVALLLVHRVRLLGRIPLVPVVALLLLAALVEELVVGGQVETLFAGGFSQDRFSLYATAALLLVALLVLVTGNWAEIGRATLGMALLACFGGLVAATATDLVTLWAGLELATLAAVAALARRDRALARRLLPALAALGALAAIGMAVVAAGAGSLALASVQSRLAQPLALPLAIGILLVVGALLAQLGAAPWLGTPATAVSGIVLVKFVGSVAALGSAWALLLPAAAAAALLLAALGAVSGGPARSIAGWAGLLQLGWVVAGIAGGSRLALGAGLFLFAVYLLASAAAEPALGATPHGLAGLAERSPARAAGFTVCLLTLAGIPPLAGFLGDFSVAAQLVRGGLFWLVALGFFSTTVVSFAVLRDLRLVYLASAGEVTPRAAGGRLVAGGAAAAAVLLLAAVLFANPISGLAVQGAAAVGLR